MLMHNRDSSIMLWIIFAMFSLGLQSCGSLRPKNLRQSNMAQPISDIGDPESERNPDSADGVIQSCGVGYTEDIAPLIETHCLSCHSAANAQGGLNLEGERSAAVWTQALASIKSGAMPVGSALPAEQILILEAWLSQGRPESRAGKVMCEFSNILDTECTPEAAKEALFPLGFTTMANSLEQYFVRPTMTLPSDTAYRIFQDKDLGEISANRYQIYEQMASEVAQRIADDPGDYLECADVSRGCADTFIKEWGPILLRRPLSAELNTQLLSVYDKSVSLGDGNAVAFKTVVQSLILSPSFLFRRQSAKSAEMSALEMITEGSIVLTDRLPSREQITKYLNNPVLPETEWKAFVEGILDSKNPATQAAFTKLFLGKVFRVEELKQLVKSEQFDFFNQSVVDAMRQESETFLHHVLFTAPDPLGTLFNAPYSFINASLNPIYGTNLSGNTLTKTDFPSADRRGILSQAAFAARFANETKTDPIHRGLFVRENLLCIDPGEVPGVFDTSIPAEVQINTRREEIEYMTQKPSCQACHKSINAMGFGFERFNAVGALQSQENGVPIDASGEIIGTVYSNGPYANMQDLGLMFANSLDVKLCFSKHILSYVLSRSDVDQCLVRKTTKTMLENGSDLRKALIETLTSTYFRQRIQEEP